MMSATAYKKLSYCLGTARRKNLPKIAEMDVDSCLTMSLTTKELFSVIWTRHYALLSKHEGLDVFLTVEEIAYFRLLPQCNNPHV